MNDFIVYMIVFVLIGYLAYMLWWKLDGHNNVSYKYMRDKYENNDRMTPMIFKFWKAIGLFIAFIFIRIFIFIFGRKSGQKMLDWLIRNSRDL